jgi:hypothetical protein
MSEKDQKDQTVEGGNSNAAKERKAPGAKPAAPSREDRLADALRANLRRRKSAAKARKED